MCSVVSSSVLQKGHVVSNSFLLLLHFVFYICNLIFMISFMVLLSHFLIYFFLSHLSFCTLQHFVFPAYLLSFFFLFCLLFPFYFFFHFDLLVEVTWTCSKNIGRIVNIPIASYIFDIRFVSITYWKS